MTNLLIRLFVKNSGETANSAVRESYGKLAGAVGIASNLALFAMKVTIGLLSGSIAIMADAVNNLSDCASSVITLVGFRLAGMPPDEKHPYGHARFEYISGLVVSFLIIAIGFEFLTSSVGKILRPEPVAFDQLLVLVLLASIGIKWWQGAFNKSIGKRIASDTLKATAADSINDVITTSAVLVGATVAHFTGLNLDGWLGLGVAVFVLISGIGLVGDTIGPLLGLAPDGGMVEKVQDKILTYPSVRGVHDLIVHNYGPGRCFASVHVEVPAEQDILISHDIVDNIERDIFAEMGIELVVHMDPLVTNDQQLEQFRALVKEVLCQIDPLLTFHDFRMVEGKSHTNLIFDVVVPPRYAMSDTQLRQLVGEKVRQRHSNFFCVITVDRSYTTTRQ